MTDPRVAERAAERAAPAWSDAAREAQLPVPSAAAGEAHASGAPPAASGASGVGRAGSSSTPDSAVSRWRRRVLRVLRDAAIAAAIVAAVPLGLTTVVSRMAPLGWYLPRFQESQRRVREAELSRPLASAKDPSVTARRAGDALAGLAAREDGRVVAAFPLRAVERYDRPWKSLALPDGARAWMRSNSWNGPDPSRVIKAAPQSLSPQELAYLRVIATAPVWPAFDLVASAPAVDVIGGRFQLPFSPEARIYSMPIWSFAASKELAYANVSRAAYYLAIGKPAEADAVLRRTISFGFVFIDNATNLFDALLGRVIVNIGRGALQDFYTVTKDARLADVEAAGREIKAPASASPKLSNVEEARQMHLAGAGNAALARAVRLQHLESLAQSVCTNPRELVLGPARDVRDVYAKAERDLARFPSERALLDLMLQTPSLPVEPSAQGGGVARLVVGASTIASIIFDNPRLAYCAATQVMR